MPSEVLAQVSHVTAKKAEAAVALERVGEPARELASLPHEVELLLRLRPEVAAARTAASRRQSRAPPAVWKVPQS